jgi:hypothetical protein
MARSPCIFKQQDITRAIKGATKAGVNIRRIEIAKDGRIVIITAAEVAVQIGPGEDNEWDQVR